jgi:high affinity Mn2+ porin
MCLKLADSLRSIRSAVIFSFFISAWFALCVCMTPTAQAQDASGDSDAKSAQANHSASGESEPHVPESWTFHAQSTVVSQDHPDIHSPYSGANSLDPDAEWKTSFSTTFFLGAAISHSLEFYLDPEFTAGSGFSGTHGIAGFPNGEIYRVDSTSLKGTVARVFLKKTWEFGGESEWIEGDQNQMAKKLTVSRFTLLAGRFSLNDYFDQNTYSHDSRTQFLNWALMDNGAWDYAADTRGYTYGVYAELNQKRWALRFAAVMEPQYANELEMDKEIWQAHSENIEFEYRYSLLDHPGKARAMTFLNHANMGNYAEVLATPADALDITRTRTYCTKYGFGLNFEQEITADLGAFLRAGWNNGTTETWAFTEIDRSLSFGVSERPTFLHRENDRIGLAMIVNGLSSEHANYLTAGGIGFMIGDGKLNYAPEEIGELYYSYQATKTISFTPDFQFVNHPGYNADRGPVPIYSLRGHFEI